MIENMSIDQINQRLKRWAADVDAAKTEAEVEALGEEREKLEARKAMLGCENVDSMNISQINSRLKELDDVVTSATSVETIERCTAEKRQLIERKEELSDLHDRQQIARDLQSGKIHGEVIETHDGVDKRMNNNDLQMRAFQKYIVDGGTRNMNETEQRALDLSGSAAVLPTTIMNKLISSEKYSDLLNRATVFTEEHAGTLQIPIASNTAADWKLENSSVDGSEASYEATPTLTKLELKGYELYRWARVSAASLSRSTAEFETMLLQLLSNEIVESLEKSFLSGTGNLQPKGLSELTYTPDTDEILTASAATPIAAADLAEAISLLPQRYARNAIVLCNADMLYQISQFKGTTEYAFDQSQAITAFLGKPIVISEHVADDNIYVVDPKELYVRFSMPIQVEANRASGFTAASIDLRALTVVDACWNQKAVVHVGLGSVG